MSDLSTSTKIDRLTSRAIDTLIGVCTIVVILALTFKIVRWAIL